MRGDLRAVLQLVGLDLNHLPLQILADLIQQLGKLGGEEGLLRINHNIHRNSRRQMAANRLAQPAFHPITIDCAT